MPWESASSPGVHRTGRSCAPIVSAYAGRAAVELFSDNLLQHVRIERESGHQAFSLGVLLTELPQFTQLTDPRPRVFPFPHIERLRAALPLPANVHHGRLTLRLPQGGEKLFLSTSTSSCHRRLLLLCEEDHSAGPFIKLPLAYFSGFGSA